MASTTTNTMTILDTESIKKYLFKITMKSQWKEVVQICRQNPQVRKARITRTGDTALHIAFKSGSYLSLTDRIIYHCKYMRMVGFTQAEGELRVERPDSSNTFTQAATLQLS
ncbi:unnamed protein product [Prunus armeniaca]